MKKLLPFIILTCILGITNSCAMRDDVLSKSKDGKDLGALSLNLETNNDNIVIVRGSNDLFSNDDVNAEKYTITITNDVDNSQVKQCLYSEIVADGGLVQLPVGKYTASAYNYDGSSTNSSSKPYFFAKTTFNIIPGGTTNVNLDAKLQNMGVVLTLDSKFTTEFKDDYSITVTNGTSGNYIFNKTNINEKIFFSVPDNANSFKVSLKATNSKNKSVTKSYDINKPTTASNGAQLKSGDIFYITLSAGDQESVTNDSQANVSINVDLTMNEKNETIEVPTENITESGNNNTGENTTSSDITLTGLEKTYTFDAIFSNPASEPVKVIIKAPNGIDRLLVKITSNNQDFMDVIKTIKIEDEFDIANPDEELKEKLGGSLDEGTGIGLIDTSVPIKGENQYTFDITSFIQPLKLFGEGEHSFTIKVYDNEGNHNEGVLKIIIKS